MIDFDYINSLPELPLNPKDSQAYKISGAISGFNPANLTLTVYILTNGSLETIAGAQWGAGSGLYVMGKVIINKSMTLGIGSRLVIGETGLISSVNANTISKDNDVVSLKGNQCYFEAPIRRVFDTSVIPIGRWLMPVAYPEWFTDKLPALNFSSAGSTDWAEPINKAIRMKGSGDVCLGLGSYEVYSPIFVNAGICLRGQTGIPVYSDNGENNNGVGTTTIKVNLSGAESETINKYILYVNMKEGDNGSMVQAISYLQPGTTIENILFRAVDDVFTRCILAAAPCHFNNLTFRNFIQAIKYADYYCDGRRITNCNIQDFFKLRPNINGTVYAVDLYSNGDGCVIEGLGCSSNFFNALRIGNSCGTVVTGCILNSPVLIRNAKGVVFSANHFESSTEFNKNGNTTLYIQNSVVVLEGNFFEKSSNPSVYIENFDTNSSGNRVYYGTVSDVTAIGNQFIYNIGRQKSENDTQTIKDRILSTNIYDIITDGKGTLNLSSNFRYVVTGNNSIPSNNFPMGIQIGISNALNPTDTPSAFTIFNQMSFKISQNCLISGKNIVSESVSLNDSGNYLSYLNTVSHFPWLISSPPEGFKYEYCIYPDGKKPSSPSFKLISGKNPVAPTEGVRGVMMNTAFSSSGGRGRVAIRRTSLSENNTIVKYAVLPICGAAYLYDNGLVISGYLWKDTLDE